MSASQAYPKETAARLLAYLRLVKDKNDRGAMADLRHALNPTQAHRARAWPLLARFGRIDKPQFKTIETVAGSFAYHPEEIATGNMGTTCKQLRGEHNSFEGRFRRLLNCDRDNICEHVRPIVFAADAKGIPINYEQLFIDLWYWSDNVKVRWATEFWGAPAEEEMPVAPEVTP